MRTILLATLLPLAACGNSFSGGDDGPGIQPTGSGGARSFAAKDFTEVSVAGPDDVEVTVGPTFAVRAEGEPAVLDRVRIEVRDGELHIGRKRGAGIGGGKARLAVSLPALREAGIAGSGNMTINRVTGKDLEATIAGSGTMRIGTLAVDRAEISIAGSGDFTAAGSAKELETNIAGSGNVDAPQLVANGADITVAGSGSIRATVKGRATISLMGSGDVDLGPEARCETSKMGSGTVRCGG